MVIDKGRTLFSHLDCFACWKCGYRYRFFWIFIGFLLKEGKYSQTSDISLRRSLLKGV
ncbi:unnamed protein product [Meloidogyne enterolobii]|uniref:Uncharacterized protein n=1 Tax=Meloidogyne enterolobii TaxID=390850 RepID=A0ACB1A0Y5_MELEN